MNTGILQSMNHCGLIRQVVSEHRGFIIKETLWSYKAGGLWTQGCFDSGLFERVKTYN